jgi:hypothetical protein
MGIVRRGPPANIIAGLQSAYQIPNFVETGTFLGDTAYWASKIFQHVLTIEFSESIYRQATEKYGSVKNISFLYGHTRERLNEVVACLAAPAVFWLDAHWSGGQTYGESDECPVLDEIEIINRSTYDSYVFIDDARLFLSPPPSPHQAEQWPDITAVLRALNVIENRYIVVIEDVIIAIPVFARPQMIRYCQEVNATMWNATVERTRKSRLTTGAKRVYRGVATRFRRMQKRG